MCICLSDTSRCSTKMAKRITKTTLHDSPGTLVFWCRRSLQNSKRGVTPNDDAKCRWVRLKLATSDKSIAITWNRQPSQVLSALFGRKFIILNVHINHFQHVRRYAARRAGSSVTTDACSVTITCGRVSRLHVTFLAHVSTFHILTFWTNCRFKCWELKFKTQRRSWLWAEFKPR